MAIPVITEKPVRQDVASTDERGPVRVRQWDIYATSEQNALDLLYSGDDASPGVRRGTVYVSPYSGSVFDYGLVCQDLTVRGHPPAPVGGYGLYEITANYGYSRRGFRMPKLPPQDGHSDLTPKYRVERARVTVPVDHDINGPIVNTIGDPFDPPRTATIIMKTLVVQWFEQADNWLTAYFRYDQFENKLNSETWTSTSAPPKTVLCTVIEPEETPLPSESGSTWYLYTGRFEFKPTKTIGGTLYPGWVDTFMNRGMRSKKYVDGRDQYLVVTDDKGYPVPNPVLLDQEGYEIEPGGAPYVLTAQHQYEIDFNALPI